MTNTFKRNAISATEALAGCILVALRRVAQLRRKLRRWCAAA